MARTENLLGALSLTVADRLRSVAKRHDVSGSEQAALTTLVSHPDRTVNWLGVVLGLTSSGVTRLVDRLVERGWVTRSPGSDARQRQLRLTTSGARRAHALQHDREEALSRILSPLSGAERADLERLLVRLVTELTEDYMPAMTTCRLCDVDVCNSGGEECPLHHTVPESA
jgi:DNA-binding MarR family transcriptional regulator